MRKMLKDELDFIFTSQKLTKRNISKLEEKSFLSTINPLSHLIIRYNHLQESLKMSSKHNTNKNLLFNNLTTLATNLPNQMVIDDISSTTTDMTKTNFNQKFKKVMPSLDGYEQENELKLKIKEARSKKSVKGLTSLSINREQRRVLVNSISSTQYIYDALYLDTVGPIELKGHSSSYFVKSVLSPNGDYVLSGSSDSSICLWNVQKGIDLNETPEKITGFHQMEVNAVDWGRSAKCFIASACDSGLILLWDDI